MNEHVDLLKAYLIELCGHIERHERTLSWPNWRKRALSAATPLAVGLALASCAGDVEQEETTKECTGTDCVTLCADKLDNDGDGTVDCADDDCAAATTCGAVAVYSAPMPETNCSDKVDNDGDKAIDCADDDCAAATTCGSVAEYGVALEQENCSDKIDNDGDDAIDCADNDCAAATTCGAVAVYSVPMGETKCEDKVDNDSDGLIDCDDTEDCMCEVPIYSIFMEPE